MDRKDVTLIVILLAVLGFLVRAGFIYFAKSYENPSTYEYGEIAANIMSGRGFSRVNEFSTHLEPTSSHAPLYPFLLSLLSAGSGRTFGFPGVQLLQAILSVLTVFFIYGICRRLYDRTTGVLAAMGLAFYPPLIYYTLKFTPVMLFVFLLSISLYLIIAANGNVIKTVAAGVFVGLTVLCDPVGIALIPALIVCTLLYRRLRWHTIAIILLVSCAVLIPWTVRNFRIHRRIVVVTTQYAKNLWIGNNPRATGTDYYRSVHGQHSDFTLMTQTLPRETKIVLGTMSEIEQADFFLQETWRFVCRHPQHFIRLLLQKTFYYWWRAPSSITASPDARRYGLWHTLVYAPILLFGCIGGYLTVIKRRSADTLLIVLTVFFISCIYIIAHVGLARYRLPIETCLIPLAAYAVHEAWRWYRHNHA
ncbi:MAG: glycosyltransferase family 39 protein [candidate division WOR-3 bacterium]|nr:MAG: glycosyltransferase family 39 protein [candidate division WOR-3 bacterium]